MELDKGYLGKRDKKLIECLLSISFGLIKPCYRAYSGSLTSCLNHQDTIKK